MRQGVRDGSCKPGGRGEACGRPGPGLGLGLGLGLSLGIGLGLPAKLDQRRRCPTACCAAGRFHVLLHLLRVPLDCCFGGLLIQVRRMLPWPLAVLEGCFAFKASACANTKKQQFSNKFAPLPTEERTGASQHASVR